MYIHIYILYTCTFRYAQVLYKYRAYVTVWMPCVKVMCCNVTESSVEWWAVMHQMIVTERSNVV